MFKFIFGIEWTAFITIIFVTCLVIPGEQRGGMNMNPLLFVFFMLFESIGLYMLITGLIKIIKDSKTEKYGMQCYGIIRDIKTTGASVNDKPEYKAILDFVNPETHQVETIEEIIGFDYNKYPINSYVSCKFYQGDINLEELIFNDEIPLDIKSGLIPVQEDRGIKAP